MSRVAAIDTSAKDFALFLSVLFSRQRQRDLPGAGRTFRRRTARFWQLWPIPDVVDEVHRVIDVDGIYLGRRAVILIACTDTHVVGWYLARSEHSQAWGALLSRSAPPQVVVTDGGWGFAKARSSLDTLIRTKTLFTYVDPANFPVGAYLHVPLPATNNRIEGGINMNRSGFGGDSFYLIPISTLGVLVAV
nr:hypothetical protein [Flaviflexus equikiangi]